MKAKDSDTKTNLIVLVIGGTPVTITKKNLNISVHKTSYTI